MLRYLSAVAVHLLAHLAVLAGSPEGRPLSVLQRHCAGCHGPGGSGKGGFDFVLDRERLVARQLIVPGKAEASLLFERMQKREMPPGKRQAVNAAELALVRQWIDAGAPAAVTPALAVPVTELDVSRLILADLDKLDRRAQRFARYVTLVPQANAGLPTTQIETHRSALAKVVNSLSWHPRLTRPWPIDEAATIYRINLRDYRWAAGLWDRLVTAYPYRPVLAAATVQALVEKTGSALPWLRGDWFLATASRPPFYHEFLQLPASDRALQRLLQVDVPGDLRDDRADRAGFNGSGVARNNRILERHDAAHGAYWHSYDFSDNKDRQNIFEHPLGPASIVNGFRHAGGEIIFHLPNGLFAYLLVDAEGRRIDKAPGEIVSDPRRPDRLVENGLSCIGCHARGLLPKDDQVRPHVLKNARAFPADDRAAVLALYPPAQKFRRLLDEDNGRYMTAVQRLGLAVDDPEAVTEAVLRYERVLDSRDAAAEAGLTVASLVDRVRGSAELSRVLGPLLAAGGTVQRQVYEATHAELTRTTAPARPAAAAAFAGHQGALRALAFSPDGRSAVSGGEDGTVRIWDVATGRERMCCDGHRDEVLAVAFAADGRAVLSGGRDRTARLWDAATGRELRRFTGHTDSVLAVAMAPDGRSALTGAADGTARLWDRATGWETRTLAGHGRSVAAVAFAPGGRLVLTGAHDGVLRVWDAATGRQCRHWTAHVGAVRALAFAPDGRHVLSGGDDRAVILSDAGAGQVMRRFVGHANAVVNVAFSADAKRVLSGASQYRTADRSVRVWDIAAGTELFSRLATDDERIEAVAFSPDGSRALLSRGAGAFQLWDLSLSKPSGAKP